MNSAIFLVQCHIIKLKEARKTSDESKQEISSDVVGRKLTQKRFIDQIDSRERLMEKLFQLTNDPT